MPDLRSSPPDARSVLGLARRDRAAAAKSLAELDLAAQLALVCSAPVGRRAELLDLAPEPEALIPLLPEAELCFTVKAVGLESATWLLEHATQEQVVACLDLDAWRGPDPDPARLDAWLEALSETSDDALHRSLQAVDPELLVMHLQSRLAVFQKPDDAEGWEPPAGTRTLDGQFHFRALREGDDTAGLLRMLHLLFQREYWTYFRLMQGAIWELPSDNREWALRWRTGRLEDLGFPRFDDAMALYRYLRPAEHAALPEGQPALDVSAWHLPVWIPSLPEGADSRHLLFRALSAMTPEERRAGFFAFVAVANGVAVADRMDLSDAETTPKAIEKAARWISRGLEHVARENALEAETVLRRVPMEHLFRVGANLDPEAARK
jgi:hypothetical protein